MTEETRGLVTFKGNPLTLVGHRPQVGDEAPPFSALRRDLTPFQLSEVAGKVVIINSVPSLDTPVCATQARTFNARATELGEDVRVLVVSMDLPFAQNRFCSTEGIAKLEVLSDHRDASFGLAYGLLIKELRLLARSVLVINRQGKIAYWQLVPEIAQEPDYEAALQAARQALG
ncbi:MAG: thiol peroxidase [Thermoanaerobaculum sp.]|nr:thiol peroxidase [Thermoanaerobaculum sp.]